MQKLRYRVGSEIEFWAHLITCISTAILDNIPLAFAQKVRYSGLGQDYRLTRTTRIGNN